jgi:hypothetical protein
VLLVFDSLISALKDLERKYLPLCSSAITYLYTLLKIMLRPPYFKGLTLARIPPNTIAEHRDLRLDSVTFPSTVRKALSF